MTGACVIASLAIALSSSLSAKAQLPTSGSLTVNVNGLENTEGQVCFSLYESSVGFPNDPEAVIAKQCISANPEATNTEAADLGIEQSQAEEQPNGMMTDSSLSATFSELSMGTYAVSVLHDENEDEQINQGTFGIPTEGFGFSRNPVVQTSAPEFYETAVFVFGTTTTEIDMVYF